MDNINEVVPVLDSQKAELPVSDEDADEVLKAEFCLEARRNGILEEELWAEIRFAEMRDA